MVKEIPVSLRLDQQKHSKLACKAKRKYEQTEQDMQELWDNLEEKYIYEKEKNNRVREIFDMRMAENFPKLIRYQPQMKSIQTKQDIN